MKSWVGTEELLEMQELVKKHGKENVRIVVWFDC